MQEMPKPSTGEWNISQIYESLKKRTHRAVAVAEMREASISEAGSRLTVKGAREKPPKEACGISVSWSSLELWPVHVSSMKEEPKKVFSHSGIVAQMTK